MRRRLAVLAAVVVTVGAVATAVASAADRGPSIGSVTPSGGPAGTEISYTLAGTDAAGSEQCSVSSAYRLELLAPDGTLAATGGGTVAVPEGITPGEASIRLVCYVPDATARRVIYGLCGRFDVADPTPPPRSGAASVRCPSTPRVALGQSVIAVERAVSAAFNPLLYYPLPK